MTIEAASTTLSLAWAEFGTVPFAASNVATISNMIDSVGVKLKRGAISSSSTPADTDIADWIMRGKEELAEVHKFTFRRRHVTATMTEGTYRYAMPTDYGGGYVRFRIQGTDKRTIRNVERNVYDAHYPDPSELSNGNPKICCIKNREVWFAPPPDGSYVMELEYERSGEDLTTNDISWLPEIERFRLIDFATAEAFESLHMFEEAGWYRQKWNSDLAKAKKADGRKQWSQQGYSARNVFQA